MLADPSDLLLLAAIGLPVGFAIGGIGIGGVLLVPGLVYLAGADVHAAIGICMFAYLFSGVAGVIAYARRGAVRWPAAAGLAAGAMPGAFLGAVLLATTPATAVEALVAGFVLFSGLHALIRPPSGEPSSGPGPAGLAAVGFGTGLGSAISGTGGPLILVPALVWLRLPVLAAVGQSQVIQVPIAALATAGNLAWGRVDLGAGAALAAVLAAGVVAGARAAHRVPAAALRRVLAAVLLAVGAALLVRGALALAG